MRRALVLSLGLLLSGCVPTADFTALREEVRELQADNRNLKEAQAQDRTATQTDVAKKLEALEARVENLRIRQQGIDQKLGELLRQAEEAAMRRQEPTASREDDGARPGGGPVAPKEPKGEAPAGPSPESQAALTPTALYNQAYNDYLKGNYDLAISGFGELLRKFPGVSQTAHAQYWIGRSYYSKKDYRQATDTYARMIADHPKSDKVPAALFEAGVAHAELGETAKAKERLKQVIDKYPQSNEASRARLKLADLK